MEAPSGLEPLNRGFADLSLSHLGTTPLFEEFTKPTILLDLRPYRNTECIMRMNRGVTLPVRMKKSGTSPILQKLGGISSPKSLRMK